MSLHYEDDSVTLHHGDCIEVMRELPDASVDSIVTDPPYGLGFMGKGWDALPPGEDWARECLRVLKPGGHLLAFGGTRTWHRLAVAVEDAGFEIRDSLFWLYGSGFPKHRAALKPACEPAVMARKPFKGSLTSNEAVHGTGALNIDACRIATEERMSYSTSRAQGAVTFGTGTSEQNPAGRWPTNVVLDDTQAAALDEQSGVSKSNVRPPTGKDTRGIPNTDSQAVVRMHDTQQRGHNDSGGASRFFYVAKAPKKERPNVDGVQHPTVKPLALMRWLVRLVTPEGGTVLEPFAGSGTTVEACQLEGFRCIAIEREAEYLPLILSRLSTPEVLEDLEPTLDFSA